MLQAFDVASNRTYLTVYLGSVWNTSDVFSSYYDKLNRLKRVMQAGPTGAVALKEVYFNWDGLDRLTSMNRFEYVTGLKNVGQIADLPHKELAVPAESSLTAPGGVT